MKALTAVRYSFRVQFEEALKVGKLEAARAILDGLAREPETGGLYVPECYAELARSFDHRRQYDDAIAAMERAIDHGWNGRPDGRSDIAEFHLRAGRAEEAARIWLELKVQDPDDVWLYNAAGLSYSEAGDHELAVAWLGEGIELAMRTDDPEGIVAQLSGVRRRSMEALGRDLDELERRADEFLVQWRDRRTKQNSRFELMRGADDWMSAEDVDEPSRARAGETAIAISWFPAGEYEKAIESWESLAEDWADVRHSEYCRRLDGNIKWMRAKGVHVRAITPIVVDEFVAWCEERDADPEEARAFYAAERYADGDAIPWPPGRNEPCWCGSDRKYKKCCGSSPAAPMHVDSEA